MLDIKLIRSQPELIAENCRKRNVNVDINKLLIIDEKVRQTTTEVDSFRQIRNDISNKMKGNLSAEERQPLIEESKQLRDQEAEKESFLRELTDQRLDLLKQVPNLTHPDSPEGLTDEENQPIRKVGEIPEFDFEPKDHVELMESLDLIDFDGGAKVSGQKFYFLKNQAVFLELALANYALNLLQKEGFTVHMTPDLARHQILDGIGLQI